MNSFTVRITGQSEIPSSLELGRSYKITTNADCVSIKKTDNHDGSFTYQHTLKPLDSEILSDNGEVIVVKDNKSQSQKLRGQLRHIAQIKGVDEEEFYQKEMIRIRHFLVDLLPLMDQMDKDEEGL